MDRLLASIFGGFWWVLGAKLGWKIEPRAIKNRLKNASKNIEKRFVLETLGGREQSAGHVGLLLAPKNASFFHYFFDAFFNRF